MAVNLSEIIMVTPFDRSIADLDADEQLLKLKGCVLCQITRRVDEDSTRNKPEWKECKAALGVPVVVQTQDVVDAAVRRAMNNKAPAVLARTEDGEVALLLDETGLAMCNGRVADLRGRMMYKAASLGLEFPDM